jgi:hypothetical protein
MTDTKQRKTPHTPGPWDYDMDYIVAPDPNGRHVEGINRRRLKRRHRVDGVQRPELGQGKAGHDSIRAEDGEIAIGAEGEPRLVGELVVPCHHRVDHQLTGGHGERKAVAHLSLVRLAGVGRQRDVELVDVAG